MSYNILVLGNGFDLAHKIPSKYRNFLMFCYLLQKHERDYSNKRDNFKFDRVEEIKLYKSISTSAEDEESFFTEIKKLGDENIYPKYDNAVELVKDNVWLAQFYIKAGDKGWIDFEREIGRIVGVLDSIYWNYIQAGENGKAELRSENYNIDNIKSILNELQNVFGAREVINETDKTDSSNGISLVIEKDKIEGMLQKISNDLTRLTELLGYYLSVVVTLMLKNGKLHSIKQIKELKIDRILSFNYTNTYKLLYDERGDDIEYHHIHGICMRNNKDDDNNMVLGVNDYLENGSITFLMG